MTKADLIMAKLGILGVLLSAFCWGWVHESVKQNCVD